MLHTGARIRLRLSKVYDSAWHIKDVSFVKSATPVFLNLVFGDQTGREVAAGLKVEKHLFIRWLVQVPLLLAF